MLTTPSRVRNIIDGKYVVPMMQPHVGLGILSKRNTMFVRVLALDKNVVIVMNATHWDL